MAYGIRVRDPAGGAITLEYTDSLTMILASFTTAENTAGSVTIPGLSGAVPFVSLTPLGIYTAAYTLPNFSFSGDTASWTAASVPCLAFVGTRS